MRTIQVRVLIAIFLAALLWFAAGVSSVRADEFNQQPTVAIPTVTGTDVGLYIRVNADQDQINVRSGPSADYDKVGVLIAGETAPAIGRSAGGTWIQIIYPGTPAGIAWVYSPLVTLNGSGDLPIVEPPPTSTPLVTPTLDLERLATFVNPEQATRLPSFTAPPPLVIPTFEAPEEIGTSSAFPFGLVISFLGIVGILGAIFSFLRGR